MSKSQVMSFDIQYLMTPEEDIPWLENDDGKKDSALGSKVAHTVTEGCDTSALRCIKIKQEKEAPEITKMASLDNDLSSNQVTSSTNETTGNKESLAIQCGESNRESSLSPDLYSDSESESNTALKSSQPGRKVSPVKPSHQVAGNQVEVIKTPVKSNGPDILNPQNASRTRTQGNLSKQALHSGQNDSNKSSSNQTLHCLSQPMKFKVGVNVKQNLCKSKTEADDEGRKCKILNGDSSMGKRNENPSVTHSIKDNPSPEHGCSVLLSDLAQGWNVDDHFPTTPNGKVRGSNSPTRQGAQIRPCFLSLGNLSSSPLEPEAQKKFEIIDKCLLVSLSSVLRQSKEDEQFDETQNIMNKSLQRKLTFSTELQTKELKASLQQNKDSLLPKLSYNEPAEMSSHATSLPPKPKKRTNRLGLRKACNIRPKVQLIHIPKSCGRVMKIHDSTINPLKQSVSEHIKQCSERLSCSLPCCSQASRQSKRDSCNDSDQCNGVSLKECKVSLHYIHPDTYTPVPQSQTNTPSKSNNNNPSPSYTKSNSPTHPPSKPRNTRSSPYKIPLSSPSKPNNPFSLSSKSNNQSPSPSKSLLTSTSSNSSQNKSKSFPKSRIRTVISDKIFSKCSQNIVSQGFEPQLSEKEDWEQSKDLGDLLLDSSTIGSTLPFEPVLNSADQL